jgi:hypothetical protein
MELQEYKIIESYLERENLKSVFRLSHKPLTYSPGTHVSFYCQDRLVNTFEIESGEDQSKDAIAFFEYCIGYLDCFVAFK